MANLHAVVATAVSVSSATETVVATLTAFNENEPTGTAPDFSSVGGPGAQGVFLTGRLNAALGSGATAAVLRIRKGSLTGAVVDTAFTSPVTASTTVDKSIDALDPTYLQTGVVYVLTLQLTNGSSTTTVNHASITAQDATSVE